LGFKRTFSAMVISPLLDAALWKILQLLAGPVGLARKADVLRGDAEASKASIPDLSMTGELGVSKSIAYSWRRLSHCLFLPLSRQLALVRIRGVAWRDADLVWIHVGRVHGKDVGA
jgi:hypothetical protein